MNRLEYYRRKRGLTQEELAERSGIFQKDVSRAEKGVVDLKGMHWLALAKALGCTVDELLGA